MKLASLAEGGPDGTLIVIDRTFQQAVVAREIAPTMRVALDAWEEAEPYLAALSDRLNAGEESDAFPLEPDALTAPLPRAAQFLDASGYLNHIELARRARGDSLPDTLATDPLMYQGASELLLGARTPIRCADDGWGIDFEAETAVITGPIEAGASAKEAGDAICLFMLINDVSLRRLVPAELAKGFGFIHGKPPSACSLTAVTADELGDAWDGARLHGALVSTLNGEKFGDPDCGVEMQFGFPELLAHAAKTRCLGPGTILGSGTVSNSDRARGSSCILERRMIEKIDNVDGRTAFMRYGDRIQIDMTDPPGNSYFGGIDQVVTKI
jgi:fumarylacetoacetate (FAA) hydrolase